MNRKVILIIIILAVFFILFFYRESAVAPVVRSLTTPAATSSTLIADSEYKKGTVTVGRNSFRALVSDTEALRTRGLSGRIGLDADQAMVFVFDSPDMLGFWMKDMLFSIDIVWLDADSRVVSIEKNISPDTYPKIFFPSSPSMYVIEFSAGTLDSAGLSIGDSVQINLDK